MSVKTVLASAVKPEVSSYTRLALSTEALGRRHLRQVKSAQGWCEAHGLELADDARHSDVREVVVLTEPDKAWTVSSMHRAEEHRRIQSMRARNGSRKEAQ